MPGPVVFFSIGLKDPAAAQPFFREVFGWDMGPGTPGISFATIDPKGPEDFDPKGVITQVAGESPPFISVFVRVASLEGALKRSIEMGGETIAGPFKIGTGADIALIRGPESLVFGVVQE